MGKNSKAGNMGSVNNSKKAIWKTIYKPATVEASQNIYMKLPKIYT